ncbi:hypothetical protein DQX05_13450 [Paenibacillus thiaminolyticus]|uniref:Uncharacterized protein n=1 Tax=Paenibacillus thiaminolyticus TaxID=49283 RepID=A0A3A3GKX6_PANTH|nr:hypothetical protein DQX05_13450 [Paenibacillus thiaminolyticus]
MFLYFQSGKKHNSPYKGGHEGVLLLARQLSIYSADIAQKNSIYSANYLFHRNMSTIWKTFSFVFHCGRRIS